MISYIVVKTVSGQDIIATLEDDTKEDISISYPIVIENKQQIIEGSIKNYQTAKPLCSYSDEPIYRISKNHVLFYKELHISLVPIYMKAIETYDEVEPEEPDELLEVEGNSTIH